MGLEDGSCIKFRGKPDSTIEYDWSFRKGHQGMEYSLSSGNEYYFKLIDGGVGFFVE